MNVLSVTRNWIVVAALLTAVTFPLGTITIENANTPGYVTPNDAFTGVVSITANGGFFGCTDALVASNFILTAGHCVNGNSDFAVTFQTGSGLTTIGVVNAILDPLYAPYPVGSPFEGLSEYDVAVLQLASAAPTDAQI